MDKERGRRAYPRGCTRLWQPCLRCPVRRNLLPRQVQRAVHSFYGAAESVVDAATLLSPDEIWEHTLQAISRPIEIAIDLRVGLWLV